MPAYVLVDLDLTDKKEFKAYASAVQDTVTFHGGRYTCRWATRKHWKGNGRPTES